MKNSKQPAFPVSKEMCEYSEITEYPYGITKREYFAAKIIQSLIISEQQTSVAHIEKVLGLEKDTYSWSKHWTRYLTTICIKQTDLLLAELQNEAIY